MSIRDGWPQRVEDGTVGLRTATNEQAAAPEGMPMREAFKKETPRERDNMTATGVAATTIREVLDALQATAYDLRSAVDRIEERIAPFLRPEPPTTASVPALPPAYSDVAGMAAVSVGDIQGQITRIHNLADRVDWQE